MDAKADAYNTRSRPYLVLLTEPWIDFDQIRGSFWNGISLKPFGFNVRGNRIPNLWCLCVHSLDPVVIYVSSQFCAFKVVVNQQCFFIAAVYASTLYQLRKELWKGLAS